MISLRFLIVLLLLGTALSAAPVSFRVGLGYESISQEYFQDSIIAGDSLGQFGSFKTTYIDESRAQFLLRYLPRSGNSLDLESGLDLSSTVTRIRGRGSWLTPIGRAKLQLQAEVDRRLVREQQFERDDGYLTGLLGGKLNLPLGDRQNLVLSAQGDFVTFDSVGESSFDYSRWGGKVAFQQKLGDLSQLTLTGFFASRSVVDTTALSYTSGGLDGSLFALFGSSTLDILARGERREYNRITESGDYFLFDFMAEHEWPIGSMLLREHVEMTLLRFASSDSVNPSSFDFSASLLAGAQFGGVTGMIGPVFRGFGEQESDLFESQDFWELGGRISLELLTSSGTIASLESTTGRRELAAETDLQTSFLFERVSLLADSRLIGSLRLNLLFSAEWEWHDRSENDNTLYLISSGVSYTF